MNEIVMQSLLYDFYGELLTDNQKEIYEQFILEDLSLGEIAKERGSAGRGFTIRSGAAKRRWRDTKKSFP